MSSISNSKAKEKDPSSASGGDFLPGENTLSISAGTPSAAGSSLPHEKTDNENTAQEKKDLFFMGKAIEAAKNLTQPGEVPVGAVIVKDGEIISVGTNHRENEKNCLCHAEIEAINKACQKLNGWRLWQCTLYVTLEPCPMCAGAIINARIPRVVFGAYDKKNGSCGSVTNLFLLPYNHQPQFVGGILHEECSAVLKDFFKRLRKGEVKQFGTHHE